MSDTKTLLFTQVPKIIEREWTCKESDLSALLDEKTKDLVYESIITKVRLVVEFNAAFQQIPEFLTEDDDVTDERIENWRNAQRTYTELVKALEPVIRTLVKETFNSACEQKAKKVTLLKQIRTKFHKSAPYIDDTSSKITTPHHSPILGRAETIFPDDSATNISPTRIEQSTIAPSAAATSKISRRHYVWARPGRNRRQS